MTWDEIIEGDLVKTDKHWHLLLKKEDDVRWLWLSGLHFMGEAPFTVRHPTRLLSDEEW